MTFLDDFIKILFMSLTVVALWYIAAAAENVVTELRNINYELQCHDHDPANEWSRRVIDQLQGKAHQEKGNPQP